MIKILDIIGARPQIIKSAAISRAVKSSFVGQIQDVIVHTGQHYDKEMSDVFFEEMGIPKPDYNLNVGSSTHGKQTAGMIKGLEELILSEKPTCVLLYGDTNSTLAGAIAASKLHCPVVHVEAGLRSFNKSMPEEINRIMCDHTSTLLFTPTETGLYNLKNEGFDLDRKPPFTIDHPGVFHCGDVMYDNSLYFAGIAAVKSEILKKESLVPDNYILVTIHRDSNTDVPERLSSIFLALSDLSKKGNLKIVLPLHPRTKKMLPINLKPSIYQDLLSNKNISIIPPAGYLDMIQLEKNAKMIITDSGGVQKEAFFFCKPCIIMRPETEWTELVKNGNAIIADADYHKILNAYTVFNETTNLKYPAFYGDGKAAEFICKKIIDTFHE